MTSSAPAQTGSCRTSLDDIFYTEKRLHMMQSGGVFELKIERYVNKAKQREI